MMKRRDPDPESCPQCGGGDIHRIISNTSFKLKGSGWYVTDYASPSTARESETESTSGDDAGESSSASEDGASDAA